MRLGQEAYHMNAEPANKEHILPSPRAGALSMLSLPMSNDPSHL